MLDSNVEIQAKVPEEEKRVSAENRIQKALSLGRDYLLARMRCSSHNNDEDEIQMRIKGTKLQHHLAKTVLGYYQPQLVGPKGEPAMRMKIRNIIAPFWREYHHEVVRPLEEAGIDVKDPTLGREMVLSLERGVRGLVATGFMARQGGWTVIFPTPALDAVQGVDLIIQRRNQSQEVECQAGLQIKCVQNAPRMRIGWESDADDSLIRVILPGNERFYRDPMLGIPHTSHIDTFNQELDKIITPMSYAK